jgi:hypothetical protein
MRMSARRARSRRQTPVDRSAISNVHRDFHAESKLNCLRGLPYHVESPGLSLLIKTIPSHRGDMIIGLVGVNDTNGLMAHITVRRVIDAHRSVWRALHKLKELRR